VVREMQISFTSEKPMNGELRPALNQEAVASSTITILAVPAKVAEDFLRQLQDVLQDKILIDCTVALDPSEPTGVRPGHVATAITLQSTLGNKVRVVSGFHTVAAAKLAALEEPLSDDTFFAGDDSEAKAVAINLASEVGLRAFDVGPLENAGTLERLTAMLISLNKRYKRRSIGLKLTGI
jgi:8-hydroxy-5-deazaflavin:NADPH oxidoreductase